jgi:hypothetical protein
VTTGEEGNAIAQSASFSATAAIGDSALVRELDRSHQRWRGIWATRNLFDVLQIAPAAGSVPAVLPGDGAPRVMFISDARWRTEFAADPGVIGRELRFADNKRFVVGGVLPPGLEFPFARPPHPGHGAGFLPGEQDYWILAPDAPGAHPGGVMVARLAAGQDREHAQAALSAMSERLAHDYPASQPGRTLVVIPLREQILGPLAMAVPMLQGFALVVLAIACANLGGLLTARAAAREDELTVRLALGARLSDLIRLRAAEAFGVAAIGIGIGMLAAIGIALALRSFLYDAPGGDPWAVPAAGALLLVVALAASLGPAARGASTSVITTLRRD